MPFKAVNESDKPAFQRNYSSAAELLCLIYGFPIPSADIGLSASIRSASIFGISIATDAYGILARTVTISCMSGRGTLT
jgi:hypothetical protein